MSRIIAGAAGGLALANVPGTGTRPTTDRVKEALFSRLESYDILHDAVVLDLFAGSGALGIECASRGAARVELVELNEKAAGVCRRNADQVNTVLRRRVVQVHRTGAEGFLAKLQAGGHYNLVLMDPPYTLTDSKLALLLDLLVPVLAGGAVVVVERSSRSPQPQWPAGLECFSDRKYGETQLWFAEPAEASLQQNP
ncbi:methyltransferase [Arthrobacter crystallopoietes BAB-32]|uniref:Methyltransferase n=1 Tax=Arthrobacter crystallopoietes BAB-32 TaxID=1246476 RepID=N1V9F5_9MICC|nr:16S rRNA (guanine(966)-N(2))-methyltransferase RsmD [Arthrobacter crystallopoietes]EMY34893.1 methyltransferase [Arthrobacter crystallopoietes BAB-32]